MGRILKITRIEQAYKSLIDLTRESENENIYFSVGRVFCDIDKDRTFSERDNRNLLENLVSENRAIKVIGESSDSNKTGFYRAILEG